MPNPIPYYQDDRVTLYHGDARDIVPALEPGSVKAVVTDPPFFMPATHYQARTHYQRAWSDTSILAEFWRTVVDDSVRALSEDGHLVTFCNGESYAVFYPELYRRFDTMKSIVWDKGQIGMGRVWRNRHELVIAARWKGSTFTEDGVTRSDVLAHKPTHSSRREHPVEKPAGLLADLILPITAPGDLVLDPFAGSGTTGEAALSLGRRAILIEGEKQYCDAIVRRLTKEPARA